MLRSLTSSRGSGGPTHRHKVLDIDCANPHSLGTLARALNLVFGVLALAARGLGQQQPPDTLPGFRVNNIYENGAVDHLSLYSGDPSIVIPLGPEYPLGPGSTWQLKAYYSSNLWTMFEEPLICPGYPSTPIRRGHVRGYPALGIGWTLELGYMHASQCGGPTCVYTYVSPDGGRHGASNANGGITSDGTQLRMACSPAGGYTSCTVESPDGTMQTFAHQYRAPMPVSGVSPDFSDDPTASTVNRLGLSSVTDRFGTTLLTVTYASDIPSSLDAWRVTAINLNGNPARAVTYTWGNEKIGAGDQDPTWQVVRQIKFPSGAGVGRSLLALFDYDQNDPFIRRNGYDNSWLFPAQCDPSSTAVQVPFLQGLRLADEASPSVTLAGYGHQYFLPPVSELDNRAGVLTRLTLPTGGTIEYSYSTSSANDNVGLPVDLESSGGGAPQAPGGESCDITFMSFWNANPVVVSRTIKTSLADPGSVTNYARDQYRPPYVCLPSEPDANRVTRRVIVTEPTGNGTSRRATKYLFHVGLGSSDVSGIELERRYYVDTNTGGNPVRTVVNCFEADSVVDGSGTHCGYLEPGGANLQQYHMGNNVRRSREVIWYGPNPTGGGSCSLGSSPPCVQTAHSAYSTNAKEYGTTTLSSSVSATARTISTNWTRTSQSLDWLLKLYDGRTTTEGSGVVDQGFEFDAEGFLKGSFTYDSARQRAAFNCRYTDGVGNVVQEFSENASSASRPPSNACFVLYPSMPTVVGTNSNAFGKLYGPYSTGLMTSAKWMNGAAPADWFSFDVGRETATGLVTFSRDTAQVKTDYTYDALGRLTQIAPPVPEIPTVISYDSTTQTTVSRSGGAGLTTWEQYLYDGLGRLLREIRKLPTGSVNSYAVRARAYDGGGREYYVSEWGGCASVANCADPATLPAGTVSSNFDPFGRPEQITKADNSIVGITYTDGSVLFSDTRKTVTIPGVNCLPGSCQSPSNDSVTDYKYDLFGRLVEVVEPGGDQTKYTYDVNDNLATVKHTGWPSFDRSFGYDSFGFLRSESTPEKGLVTYDEYGGLGNLLKESHGASSLTKRYCYDFAGRVSELRTNAGATAPTCAGAGTLYLANTYNNITSGGSLGKLTSRVATTHVTGGPYTVTDTFTYAGAGGRLSQRGTAIAGGSNLSTTQKWTYNLLGLVSDHHHARETPPTPTTKPFVVSVGYDNGMPIAAYANGIPVVRSISYHPSGSLASYVAGSLAQAQRVKTSITQASAGIPRPAEIRMTNEASQAQVFTTGSYSYDGAGNIMSMGSDTFTYDLRSRLCKATLAGAGSQWYQYDRFGNLVTKLFTSTSCAGSTPWANNRTPTATHDLRGNVTSLSGAAYTYDGLDQMVKYVGGGLTFTHMYDGSGERVAKISAGAWSHSSRDDANRVAAEFGSTAPTRDNVFLGNLLVASYASVASGGPNWTFYGSDHLGTPRLVTDLLGIGAGADAGGRRYWPYGEPQGFEATNPGIFQRLRFALMERDTEANYYHDHARSHDFILGRFLSPDQLQGKVRDPQTWNRYTYALNNPLKYVDPNGQAAFLWEALDFYSYNESRNAWSRALQHFRDNPTLTTGATATAKFIENAYDSAALLVPALPGVFGIAGKATRLLPGQSWGRLDTLPDHFARHGADFGAATADAYARQASDFLQTAQAEKLPTKIDSHGTIRVYDPETNTFAAYNADGTTKTFFKPPEGREYWEAQPGVLVRR